MGLLDALKRDKPSLTIEVDPAEALPGEEVRVRVAVEGELDDKAQSLRAGVRCVNRYLVEEYDHDDDHSRMREVWRSLTLHEEAHDLPREAGTHQVACAVPPHALPSSADAVGWWAWAHLERRKGFDVKEAIAFAVPLRADAVAAAGPPSPPAGGVSFSELPARALAGEEVSGVLTVAPPEDLKLTGIEVKLRRVRTYSADGVQLVKKNDVAQAEVCGSQDFRGGDTAQVAFSIGLPADAGPSVAAPHTVVTWLIEATAKRRLRPDHVVKAPLVVVNASRP